MIKQLCLFIVILCLIGCASNPTEGNENGVFKKHQFDEGTQLSTPSTNDETSSEFSYFAMIDKEILSNIYIGTPSSIQLAMSELRMLSKNSEQAKVLLYICNAIMEYVWPSTPKTEYIITDLPTNVYTIIIDSVTREIYDDSLEITDFFTLTIPSLVLCTQTLENSYFDDSKIALEKSLELYNDSLLTQYLLALLHTKKEEYDSAINYFTQLLELDPANNDIKYSYLESLYLAGKYNELYDASKEMLSENPKDATLLTYCAQATYNLGLYDETNVLISEIVVLDDKNTTLFLLQAKVLFELKNYFDSANALDQFLKNNSDTIDSLVLKTKLELEWKKDVDSAIHIIELALNEYPLNEELLLAAAELSVMSGKKINNKEAYDYLSIVLETDAENIAALRILLDDFFVKDEWEQAYKISSHIAEISDQNEELMVKHVQVCLELGFLLEARDYVDILYSQDTSNILIQQAYLQLLIAEENFSEAEKLINSLLPASSGAVKSMLFYERSKIQSDTKLKLADLRSSLTSNPRNESTLFELYMYYFDRGDYNKAQYYIKQVMVLKPNVADIQNKYQELQILLQ